MTQFRQFMLEALAITISYSYNRACKITSPKNGFIRHISNYNNCVVYWTQYPTIATQDNCVCVWKYKHTCLNVAFKSLGGALFRTSSCSDVRDYICLCQLRVQAYVQVCGHVFGGQRLYQLLSLITGLAGRWAPRNPLVSPSLLPSTGFTVYTAPQFLQGY